MNTVRLIGSCVTLYRRAGTNWGSQILSHRYFGAMLKIITHDPMRERRGDHPGQNIVSMSIAGIVVGSLMLTVQRAFPPHQVCMTGGAETVAHSFSVRGRRRRRRDDRVLAHLPRGALPVGHRSRGLPLRNSSISSLIGSCVIIFGTGSQYRRFRGLKHLMRDSIASSGQARLPGRRSLPLVQSHARPYQTFTRRERTGTTLVGSNGKHPPSTEA